MLNLVCWFEIGAQNSTSTDSWVMCLVYVQDKYYINNLLGLYLVYLCSR